ncbi:MAG: hypothetical protein GY801_34910 [bacterium]|nr:hypothetical protein [bacterium]
MFLNKIFDIFAFSGSPAARYLFIVLLSLVTAVIFLVIFKKTSNQKKIKYHKNKIFGYVLQIPLYKDRFGLLIRSILNIFKHNGLYIAHTLVSLVFIIIPLIFLMVQLDNRYGYEPLQAEQQFFVQADLKDGTDRDILEKVFCETSPEVRLETLPLRLEDTNSVLWRAKVVNAEPEHIPTLRFGIEGDGQPIEKELVTDYGQSPRFAPAKKQASLFNKIFYNAEGYLPKDSPFSSISTQYSRAGYSLVFWDVDVIILFFIFTLIFGFALKGVFKVDI